MDIATACTILTLRVVGTSMLPILQTGDHIEVTPLHCIENPIKKADMVLFHSGIDKNPIVKTVHATKGDKLKVTTTSTTSTIYVNNEEIHTTNGSKFNLSAARGRMIKLYEGTLAPETYLVMGENVGGTNDSSRIGLINAADIVGKVTKVIKK